jgi:enamine deaminase RidA (YjgF/YER057c/UK114 family)
MQRRSINSPDGPATPGTYAQAMLLSDARALLFVSGQIGIDRAGAAPAGFAEQARLAWANVDAQLRAAGMSRSDLVKVTIFLSDRRHIPEYRATRDEYLAGHEVALTCIVAGIFDSDWLLEIEAVAAH